MSKRRTGRKRDVIDLVAGITPTRPEVGMKPTPEQVQHGDFVEREIHERRADGTVSIRGRHWRRRPRFETVSELSLPELLALRGYRAAFDASEMSATKSALDIRPGGGAGGAEAIMSRLEQIAFADIGLKRIEAQIAPEYLLALRAVALQDMDFKQAAIAIYGSRVTSQVDIALDPPRVTVALSPKSGRHRERVKSLFLAGAKQLAAVRRAPTAATAALPPTIAAPEPPPAIDPRFLDDRGLLRPFEDIRAILLGLDEAA